MSRLSDQITIHQIEVIDVTLVINDILKCLPIFLHYIIQESLVHIFDQNERASKGTALFMLAIVMVRHEVTLSNIREQFSPFQLTDEVNSLPFGNKGNFNVDALALSHGIAKFFKGIKDSVTNTVQYHTQKGGFLVYAYHSLPPTSRGINLHLISSHLWSF
jgi:hypothetical protein